MIRQIVGRIQLRISPFVTRRCRQLCTDTPQGEETDGEKRLMQVLKEKFPSADFVQVQDISGGCGAMYDVQLVTPEFEGKRTVLQHRMVNEALKEEIQDMHGLRIRTAAPSKT